jgi:class 3 adenylate cyclase
MPNLPSGTVTFLFSDIEGSTALLKKMGDERYTQTLAEHRRILRESFVRRGGQEIDTQGDAFFYSFPRARDAVLASVDAQRSMTDHDWPDDLPVRVRIGLHTGEPAVGEEGYTGLDVVRAARIAAVGRGGQVLLSETTRALVGEDLPDGVSVRSIGEQRLKDIDRPEPLHELLVPGVTTAALPADAGPGKRIPSGEPEIDSSKHPATDYSRIAETARQAIERRVLAELERSFDPGTWLGSGPPRQRSSVGTAWRWVLLAFVLVAGSIGIVWLVVRAF